MHRPNTFEVLDSASKTSAVGFDQDDTRIVSETASTFWEHLGRALISAPTTQAAGVDAAPPPQRSGRDLRRNHEPLE
jgi:hypothetical protein